MFQTNSLMRLCSPVPPVPAKGGMPFYPRGEGSPHLEMPRTTRTHGSNASANVFITEGRIQMKNLARFLTLTSRKGNGPILAIAAVLGMAICCSYALAQSGAGSIEGTVTDATGAVIPGATIHVANQATGVATDTKSSSVGFYQLPGLFTGTYAVTVGAPNMKTYKTIVELQVAQAAIINPIMTAGAVTQQIVVAGNVVQLTTTDNGTISSTLENTRIDQLPMNGRLLVTLTGNTTPGLEGGGVRANGLMPEALEYVQDGAPLTDRNFGGANEYTQAQLPDPDTVQEVRMETTNTSAQYSEPATGIITTKSGTNGLHGSFFETARNNAVGIAKGRQDPSDLVAPHLVRNEFGASAGGPIILPKVYHGKDKSFWFFAYERFSLRSGGNELDTVPTLAMRSGDFSGLIDSTGTLQVLYDPATTQSAVNNYARTPFANNHIPIARLAPATKILYDISPKPTLSANPLVAPNIPEPNITTQTVPTITFRIDHIFNETNKTYLRFTNNIMDSWKALRDYPNQTPATIAADGFPAGATGVENLPAITFSSAFGYTHVFSPTFFSETVLSQQWYSSYDIGGGNPNLNYEKMLGLPNNFGETGFPGIGEASGVGTSSPSTLIMPYNGTQFNYSMSQILSNIDENVTKTIGRHQMLFGGRYRHERFGYLPDRGPDVVGFGAGAMATGLEDPTSGATYGTTPNTGYADADFFLGAATSYSVTLEPPYAHYHDMEFDAYFQDNFHASKNLIVNLGLRYEAHPGAWTKYGFNKSFDLKTHAVVLTNPISYYITNGYTTQTIVTNLQNLGLTFESPSQAGYPSTNVDNYDFTFGPRIGLAYQPFGGKYGTVIRGAYGRYIYPVPVRNSLKNTASGVPFTASYSESYTLASQSPDGLPNYLVRAPQTVIMGTNSSNVVSSATVNSILPGITNWALAPNQAPDYVTQMNFTIEQPLKGNSAMRLTWLWSHATNLDHYYFYNSHPSTYVWEMKTGIVPPTGTYAATATGPYDQTIWGSNTWDTKDGWSNDNSLQANYQRLFHHGIAYQINYVWSKAFRLGGNYFRDANVNTAQNYVGATGNVGTMTSPFGTVTAPYLPPTRPAGIAEYANWHALNKYERYLLDNAIPLQHISFNGIVALPFGRGKRFLGNANRLLDELVGGFQIAGDGSILSQNFQPSASLWGPTNPLHTYKHGAKVTDCRSGTCYKAYEWFNGYLSPTVANQSTGVTGLPTNWAPYASPIDTTPGTANYGTSNVNVTLSNGSVTKVAYSPGPVGANRYSHTFINGPINWTTDLSIFKVFPITEKVNLRVNVDAFNALNVQGYNSPNGTDGIEQVVPGGTVASSYNTPRQLQFTMRLTF